MVLMWTTAPRHGGGCQSTSVCCCHLVVLVITFSGFSQIASVDPGGDNKGNGIVVESGKPRGSLNRWNYNEVYKAAAVPLTTPRSGQGQWDRNAFDESQRRWRVTQRPSKGDATLPPPTPGKHVELQAKKTVDWSYDTLSFYLRASSDMRFRIRHAPVPAFGSPWPMPQVYNPRSTIYRIFPGDFLFRMVGGEACDILEKNFRRISINMFGQLDVTPVGNEAKSRYYRAASSEQRSPYIRWLNVTVLKECTDFPYLEMDESYDLDIKPSGVSIIAVEVWGALRGMETFSQLVYEDDRGQFIVNKTFIRDFPRFKHRGILLDTSRHFLDKETIVANLEAMAQNKMNVFHWHIVDDQSFPYQSKVFPELSRLGAYNAETHVYTPEDIADIIEEARVRGIRVIPEFDTPGHTFSWGFGQDHLLTPCYDYRNLPNGLFGPINPILRKTYVFLHKLFAEVLAVFKDKYVHLGGDEVPFDCWQMNPAIKGFMRRNNLTDIRELLNIYEQKVLDIVTELGEKRKNGAGYIVWQEVFDNDVKVKPDTIVQVWSGDSYNIDRVTRAGLRALFSTCWYLDYISYGQDWDKYYNCEHIGMSPTDYRVGNESLLIGGEVCLWTEFADDDSIMPRIWPRASAAAERLWSDRSINNAQTAAPRIEAQRCRMMRRGLRVGVLSGPGHCAQPRRRRGNHSQAAGAVLNSGTGRAVRNDAVVALVEVNERFVTGKLPTPGITAFWWCPLAVLVVLIGATVFVLICRPNDVALGGRIASLLHVKTVPKLVTVFVMFAVVWVVWSAPFWTHSMDSVMTSVPA
jgi:hexosaminidase